MQEVYEASLSFYYWDEKCIRTQGRLDDDSDIKAIIALDRTTFPPTQSA